MSDAGLDITSPQNKWIRLARSLSRRRRRYQERAFLVDGVRPLEEAIRARAIPTAVLIDAEADDATVHSIAAQFRELGAPVFGATSRLIQHAADTESPKGILGLFPMLDTPLKAAEGHDELYVIADRVRDPGNLGTLMRATLAAGGHGLLIAPESADPYGPKVVRAAAGAHFRLPFATIRWDQIPAQVAPCRIVAADRRAPTPYDELDLSAPTCLIVGNETQGLSQGALNAANVTVGIPLANDVESLNAAIAGAVLLFEAARQRRRAGERVHTRPRT